MSGTDKLAEMDAHAVLDRCEELVERINAALDRRGVPRAGGPTDA